MNNILKIRKKLDCALIPQKTTGRSPFYNVYSAYSSILKNQECKEIETGIFLEKNKENDICGLILAELPDKNNNDMENKFKILGLGQEITLKKTNFSGSNYKSNMHSKIGEMVFLKCYTKEFNLVNNIKESKRGSNGFGSTGI